MTDGNGFVFVGGWEFGLDFTPGMYLVVSSGAVTKDILLEPVLLFAFDPETDYLAGSAPPERHVWVGTGNDSYGCGMDVTSNAGGFWEANFASQPCDVLPDMWAAAQVFDEDGDATEANPGFPRGSHDYDSGDVPSWACNVGGWAFDPDDQGRPVSVRILSDGEEVMQFDTNVDGNRNYETSLWGLISSYDAHEITVEAYDPESDTWRMLDGTPRPLTCRTYDIYAYDPLTGQTQQVTDIRDADEYNPSWAHNGRKVAHDVVFEDGTFGIYITDVQNGKSIPLMGAEGGNDADWSPNFKYIIFDRDGNLYRVLSGGGEAILVREDAVSADWAPNSQRLVFQQPSDGSIRTTPVLSGRGQETLISDVGANPSWSPDGNWIAYEYDGDIWKVAVNVQGKLLGEPVRVTSMASGDGQPTWSPDSQSIVFHSGFSRDYDLWTIPAAGGEPAWLTGAFGFGDYDPAYASNSSRIAYASFSPEGQAPRNWGTFFTHEYGTWSPGDHSYYFENIYTVPEPGGGTTPVMGFTVSEDAPRFDGTVLLRPFGIRARAGEECFNVDPLLNPDQQTMFHYGWVMDNPVTYADAVAHFDSMAVTAYRDEGMSADLIRHEIRSWGTDDWQEYLCSYTAGPPKMDLRVNYGHDWVESFYEAGHEVVLTVTDSGGAVKATATLFTEPKDFWEGGTGFQTTPEDWSPAPPDIQPYDWVYAQVDNGTAAQVQIGDITGMIDLDADAIAGTINASWFSGEVFVECFPWGAPEGVEMKYDSVLPDGNDTYSCSWSGEWDIDYYQDVGVGYFGQDGHWVANAFFVRNPRFVVFPEWEWFDGLEWPDGAWVSISVAGKSECSTGVESWGGFFNGGFPEECDVAIGDTVTFTDGTTTRTHIVRNLAVTGLDVNENTITGTADPETLVYAWPHDAWFEPLQATADEFGAWQIDLDDAGYDLMEGASGRSEIRDEVGNATAVDWYVPNPRFVVFPEWEFFDGHEWPDGAWVSISVAGKSECSKVVESWGGFFNGNFPEGCDVAIGDRVTFTDGTTTRRHDVRNLAATGLDVGENTIAGTADVGMLVYVWPHDAWFEPLQATADGSGAWQVDLDDAGYDLMVGASGRSEIRDEVGNATAVDWYVPRPRMVASITDNWFFVVEFAPGATLELDIYDSQGGTQVWDGSVVADGSGFAWINFEDHGMDLEPGTYLVVSDGFTTKDLVIEAFTFDLFDLTLGLLQGTAPGAEGRLVWVGIGFVDDDWSMDVFTAADGSWVADFGASVPADYYWVAAQIFDVDGDASELRPEVIVGP